MESSPTFASIESRPALARRPVAVLDVRASDGKVTRYASVLMPDQISRKTGVRREAIMGRIKDPERPIEPGNFIQNRAFVRFLQDVIARHSSQCPALVEEATRVESGLVYVLDGRGSASAGQAAPEDIIGIVTVRNRTIEDYRPSPGYLVLSPAGFMFLEGWLHSKLIEELLELPVGKLTLEPDPQ